MRTIIAIANQKGGVGKTTLAVNLSAGLARRGRRVLLVDLDIQGSASTILSPAQPGASLDVARCLLEQRSIAQAVHPTRLPGLDLAPAGEQMAVVDLFLASCMGRERVLERALRDPALEPYELIVLDTAPYLGLLTLNAIVASQHLLVPVSCEYLPMLGLKLLGETLSKVRDQVGADAHVLGYVLTMLDRRERITAEVEALLRSTFGDKVLPAGIRVNTHHKASPSHGQTIYEYEARGGKGTEDFERVCDEVEARLGFRSARRASRTSLTSDCVAPA